jgi:MtN3 and saliva related transmembrane protein
MSWITILGLTAGAISTFSGLPQIIKIVTTRKTRDLSLITLIMLCTSSVLWLAYGIAVRDLPLIATNAVASVFSSSALVFKLIYK